MRNSYLKLICPFQKTNIGQNVLSFTGLSMWNETPKFLKNPPNNINTFKHNLKRYYLTQLKQKVNYDTATLNYYNYIFVNYLLLLL